MPALRSDLGNIPQLLALAAAETLESLTPNIKLKWPNDLVIGHKKLGGILCEVGQSRDSWGVITGIGININMPDSLLKTIDRPATSLLVETGTSQALDPLIEKLAEGFRNHIQLFLKEGFEPFYNALNARMVHRMNEPLQFSDFTQKQEGVYKGLNRDGSLNLLLPDGSLKICTTGELL
jgi:BirA family biotin operon repressor/biotin-[acetyl-CoA-carboxylase] ligase